jgi:hypothetical protein
LVIFNSLPWKVKNWVESELDFPPSTVRGIASLKSGNENINLEVLDCSRYPDGSIKKIKIGFISNFPPLELLV